MVEIYDHPAHVLVREQLRKELEMTIEESEQLQNDIITHCDGLPPELITRLCQVVVDFQKEQRND